MTFSTLGTMASYVPKQGVTGTVDLSTATLVKGAGMDLIVPTSVAGSGVTLSGGQVSFSAATSVSVNGCFTTAYDSYRIVCFGTASAINLEIQGRLRLSGTDNAAASSYIWQVVRAISGVVAGVRIATTGWNAVTQSDTDGWSFSLDIHRPALAEQTVATGLGIGSNAVANDYVMAYGLRHNVATAFDGITFFPNGGNISGKLRVYGLRNS